MINLDNNATTQPIPEAVAAAHRALTETWHNPSSVHRAGQAARHEVELARSALATLAGVKPRELIFTSSGTESVDLAIRGALAAGAGGLVTSRIEHAAVRDLAEALAGAGTRVEWVRPAPHGVIEADAVAEAVDRFDTPPIISVQWANNETGVIQPIDSIHAVCRERKAAFHCDATQWIGKMPVVSEPPCDLMTFSPHKFHGSKGVGLLWVRRGARIRAVLHGSQELGRRGGTENVPGIAAASVAAAGAAAWLADATERERLAAARDRFERAVLEAVPGAVVNGETATDARLWNTTNIGFPGLEAEALLIALSERGVCGSAGAACSSGSLDPSPVLLAMGIPERTAHGSLRFSLCRFTTDAELDEAAGIIGECARRLAQIT